MIRMKKVNKAHELDVCVTSSKGDMVHIQNKRRPTGGFFTYGLHVYDMRNHCLSVQLRIHINQYVHRQSSMHEIQITL